MTRMSKQGKRRNLSPRRPRRPGEKTGPIRDQLAKGYLEHENAVPAELAEKIFIPKIR